MPPKRSPLGDCTDGVASNALFAELRAFAAATGGCKPPRVRTGDLGYRVYMFLRRAAYTPLDAENAAAMREYIGTLSRVVSSTVPLRRKITRASRSGQRVCRGKAAARFATNQRFATRMMKRPSAGAAAAAAPTKKPSAWRAARKRPADPAGTPLAKRGCPAASAIAVLPPLPTYAVVRHVGRPRAPFDLSDAAPTLHINGLELAPQVTVDYLYAAARDVAAFLDERCKGRWFAHWGTALGAVRDGGLIPYDVDIDFVVLVDSGADWPHLGELKTFVEHKGHSFHNASRKCVKVHPPRPYVRSLFVEHKFRAAEESKWQNLGHDQGKLASIAKQRVDANAPLKRVGRNVVDIEFAAPAAASAKAACRPPVAFQLPGANGKKKGGGVAAADLLPTTRVAFGPLMLPLPQDYHKVLRLIYPRTPTQANCLATRRYRKPHGGWANVPSDIPLCALPTTPLSVFGLAADF